MSKAIFTFNPYPYRHIFNYTDGEWIHTQEELYNLGGETERLLEQEKLHEIYKERNAGGTVPLVNYTTQYGMGCFEGLKAYPRPDGQFNLFRVEASAQRFYNSMCGLHMPPFPQSQFIETTKTMLKDSIALGFFPHYNQEDEQNDYITAKSIYVRPFALSEAGIAITVSVMPQVFFVATEVGNYFTVEDKPAITVSQRARAAPNGTGWIKCAANYVIPNLEKHAAKQRGFMEVLFLDAIHERYIEECSSCNIFFVLENNVVVTPPLNDTVLPGITRDSIIRLVKDQGLELEIRAIHIDEVFESAIECFSTGTAVGVNHFGSIEYKGKTRVFRDGLIGNVARSLRTTLKRIQHGVQEDLYNWITII